MGRDKTISKQLVAAACSALFFVAVLWVLACGPLQPVLFETFGKINLVALVIALFVGIVVYLCLNRILEAGISHTFVFSTPVAALVVVLFALFLLVSLLCEPQVYATEVTHSFLFSYPYAVIAILVFGCSALALNVLSKCGVFERAVCTAQREKAQKYSYILLCVVIVIATFDASNNPVVINGGSGNLHHFHAWFNSVYQLLHGGYFNSTMTSIYGHYAFFFLPIKWIGRLTGIHNELKFSVLVLAALSALSVLLYAYVIHKLIKNNLLRCLALVTAAMAPCSLVASVYVQSFPHRTFPYALMLAWIVFWYKNPKHRVSANVIGWLISVVALIWSTECGCVCAITWAALLCCSAIQEHKGWLLVPFIIVCAAVAIIAGYVACCGINIMLGGQWIPVDEFLFPMLTDSYMNGFLEVPLLAKPAAWMSISSTLFFFMAYGLSRCTLFSRHAQVNSFYSLLFAIGALGFGSLIYAFNRPRLRKFLYYVADDGRAYGDAD